ANVDKPSGGKNQVDRRSNDQNRFGHGRNRNGSRTTRNRNRANFTEHSERGRGDPECCAKRRGNHGCNRRNESGGGGSSQSGGISDDPCQRASRICGPVPERGGCCLRAERSPYGFAPGRLQTRGAPDCFELLGYSYYRGGTSPCSQFRLACAAKSAKRPPVMAPRIPAMSSW